MSARSKEAVSPGEISSEAPVSMGCGAAGMTTIGTGSTVDSSWPSTVTGTEQVSEYGSPSPAL